MNLFDPVNTVADEEEMCWGSTNVSGGLKILRGIPCFVAGIYVKVYKFSTPKDRTGLLVKV